MSKVFISYRREDSGPVARRLADHLARAFGANAVFIDTDAIRAADRWRSKIEDSIHQASVVLVVVGPRWLFLQDADGRRRIDEEGDWVRTEILSAFTADKVVLPVLVSGATLPRPEALPDCLRPLTEPQSYELNDRYWDRDVEGLLKRLEGLGMQRHPANSAGADVPYPVGIDTSTALTEQELNEVLAKLPDWSIINRPLPKDSDQETVELHKLFKFKSFEDAIHFMNTASRFAALTNHHPDWQNLWVSVRVWLTTWDIGHRPTFKDVRLAEHLEKLYREYTVF